MLNGQKIAELRIKTNLTQTELAEKLYVSQQLVSNWENGKRRPSYDLLIQLAKLFDVSVEELYTADDVIFEELSDCIPESVSFDVARLKNHINNFLPHLSEKERFVFLRRYYYLEDFSTIADKVGTRENQARAVLSRVKKKLRHFLLEVEQ